MVTATKASSYLGWDLLTSVEVVAGPPGAVLFLTGRSNDIAVTTELSGAEIPDFLTATAFRRDGKPVRVSPYVIDTRKVGSFNDIADNIFEDAITWMAREGITAGCNPPTNTMYCPDDDVTRGEMAVFIARMFELPPPAGDHFDDDEGEFYESAANRLYEVGITVGCGQRRYCGERPIPREQLAAFLARTLSLPISNSDHFVDDENSMFEQAIDKIADARLTIGCDPPTNHRFCPDDNVTRGQMAAFLKRAWEY